jgi:hypothetical protein
MEKSRQDLNTILIPKKGSLYIFYDGCAIIIQVLMEKFWRVMYG